jgi:hypothetical protein
VKTTGIRPQQEDLMPPERLILFEDRRKTVRSVHEEQHPACRLTALHSRVSFPRLL